MARTVPISVPSLGGSLDLTSNELTLRPDEARGGWNIGFDTPGVVTKRKGRTKLNTGGAIDGEMDNIYRYYYNSSAVTLGSTAGKVWKLTGTSFAALDDMAGTDPVEFTSFQDDCIFISGGDQPRAYDGTDVWELGLDAPASNPTLADGGAGLMWADTYYYQVTYVYKRGESNAYTETSGVTIADLHQVNLTSIPTGGSRVIGRKIYRRRSSEAEWEAKLVTYIQDNVTTSYTDNYPTAWLGDTIQPDALEPPASVAGVEYDNRLFLVEKAKQYRIWYSRDGNPEIYDATGYADLPDNDHCVALLEHTGRLFALGRRHLYVIWETTPGAYKALVMYRGAGCVARRSAVSTPYGIAWLSHDTVVLYTGARLIRIGERVSTEFDSLTNAQKAEACAAFYRGVYILAYDDGNNANTYAVAYHMERDTWRRWRNYNVNALHPCEGPGDAGLLYGAGSKEGYAYRMDYGTDDAGTAIAASWVTPAFYPHGLGRYARLAKVWVHNTAGAGSSDVTLTVDGTGLTVQNMPYTQESYVPAEGAFGKRFILQFDHHSTDAFQVDGYSFLAVLEDMEDEK